MSEVPDGQICERMIEGYAPSGSPDCKPMQLQCKEKATQIRNYDRDNEFYCDPHAIEEDQFFADLQEANREAWLDATNG